MKVNHSQLKKVIHTAYERKTPLFIWGTMGIGKSTAVKYVAREIAMDAGLDFLEAEADGKEVFSFIDVRISQLEPSDLRGIPVVKGDTAKWVTPSWLPSMPESKGILFFDELNLAPPSIQASAYQLILDRRIGDYILPDGWVIISAGNTTEDKANVYDLPAPLANRFIHIDLEVPTKDEWVSWALRNRVDASICAFLEQHPSLLHKFEKNLKAKAFPTPRSWESCSKLIKGNEIELDELEILVASAVGDGAAHEYIAFAKLNKKVDIEAILKDPKLVEKIKEIDLKYALISILCEKYRSEKTKVLDKVLMTANYMEGEFAILLLKYLYKIGGSKFSSHVSGSKVWEELAKKYSKYFVEE